MASHQTRYGIIFSDLERMQVLSSKGPTEPIPALEKCLNSEGKEKTFKLLTKEKQVSPNKEESDL